jgi:hypothetical protein
MTEEQLGAGRHPIFVMTSQSVRWIEETLWPRGERRDILMILDAARDQTIFRMLLEYRLEYSCLYSQFRSPELEIAAPYLVQLEYQDGNTRRLLERAWGNSWGVFLKCDLRLDKLRRHLRQFLVVRDPRGRRAVFRYYDPRVLRVYLPTCAGEELRSVFGPIQLFWTEGQVPEDMLEFRLHGGNLEQRTFQLGSKRISELQPPGSGQNLGPVPGAETPRGYTTLKIRQAQFAVFSQAEVHKFEQWMLVHLKRFFPSQCTAAGEPRLQEMVQYGIQRAAVHGVTAKRDVCKYIDLMIVFGRDFDTDKRSRWAGDILRQRGNPSAKMRALLVAGKRRLKNR